MSIEERIGGCLFGLAIGDALGVPVEFSERRSLKLNPVIDMRGYGVWDQPPGTWSDDSSLAFCLAECLCEGYDLENIGKSFIKWRLNGYWGAHHKVFDIGNTTRISIDRLISGEHPIYSGDEEVESNGNGSLMRIVPASIYFHELTNHDLLDRVQEISGITHRHFRSVFSCFIFSKVVQQIIAGVDKIESYTNAIKEVNDFIRTQEFDQSEIHFFNRILDGSLPKLKEDSIGSSGYVLHTLEASLWCFLNANSYESTVLKAVNLGGDTDTTACVAGALAGLYHGLDEIPSKWRSAVARHEDIRLLAIKFGAALSPPTQ